jgi:hypothetical protein
MKITKRTTISIELQNYELDTLERELVYLHSLSKGTKKPNHSLTLNILEAILEE